MIFEQFRKRVLHDRALQDRLRATSDTDSFVAACLLSAAEHDLTLTTADIETLIANARQARLTHHIESAAQRHPDPACDLRSYTPINVYAQQDQMMIDWCQFDSLRFTDPFFEETIGECLKHPYSLLFRPQTPLAELLAFARANPGITPDGFIFHMSRCGSTLITQMLASLPENIVLSEPGPLDPIIHADIDPALKIEWFRAMVAALGQRRFADEAHLFIKFDSWHTLALPLIRAAFPDTPWLFVYRDPIEVMVSNLNSARPAMLAPVGGLAAGTTQEEYCARVLGSFCEAAYHALDSQGLLIHYRELPEGVFTRIAPHFGLTLRPDQVELMRAASANDAKTPWMPFQPDSEDKRRQAKGRAIAMTAQWITPIYEKLDLFGQNK
jgi:hypothetical protein